MRSENEVPPPAYFVRSVPIMPTGRWVRDRVTTQGPYVAGLVLALAAGAGVGIGLSPSCGLTAPLPDRFGYEPRFPDRPGLPYVVQWQPMPPRLPSGGH
ncbi:hypothetical protein GCM10022226_04770 [Sphaerisporangium flaviroseum]|uniref:Uncharacterized protein n=1 Tax=Sphaerisporangium flaviroseum TaxID=509199 RepID=A0ABP7HHH2_9ACTN